MTKHYLSKRNIGLDHHIHMCIYTHNPDFSAVLAADTVPKRTLAMLQNGVFDDEMAARIHRDWPKRIYNIDTEVKR